MINIIKAYIHLGTRFHRYSLLCLCLNILKLNNMCTSMTGTSSILTRWKTVFVEFMSGFLLFCFRRWICTPNKHQTEINLWINMNLGFFLFAVGYCLICIQCCCYRFAFCNSILNDLCCSVKSVLLQSNRIRWWKRGEWWPCEKCAGDDITAASSFINIKHPR